VTKRLASRIEYGARHPVGALFAEPNVDPGRIPGRPDDNNLRGGGGRHARAKAGVRERIMSRGRHRRNGPWRLGSKHFER
jgi:hypothetical protein